MSFLQSLNSRSAKSFKAVNGPQSRSDSTNFQLRQYAEATLGSGSLRHAVKLPEGEDLNEWLAVNTVDFYNQINMLYGTVTQFCSPSSCPEMKATDEYEYLWQDSERFKKPTKLSAPEYIEHLMSWVQAYFENPAVFPSKIGVAFPKNFQSIIRTIFKRLYRVYAHIYCEHFEVITKLGMQPHLNTSLKHFVYFSKEFDLIERKDYGPLTDLVDQPAHLFFSSTSPTMLSRSFARTTSLVGRSVTRSYATASATAPPIQLFGVDGTYASALYTAAAKESALDATSKGLASINATLSKEKAFAGILANPALSAADKATVVEALSKSVKSAPAVTNLLSVLADNNRLGLLPSIITNFGTLMSAYKGEVEATVTSATPLDSKLLSRIESAIAKSEYVGAGKKLKISNKVNPEILGGLVVELGDRTVDLSVSSKISRLNALISEAV
ncbi:Mob1/phocein [Kockiozyma suomiensis]|uniref:Mob1/phocein n=1 Tax=Kockiozyma suomiensis TaxID=1337062 RepID=UPI003343D36E